MIFHVREYVSQYDRFNDIWHHADTITKYRQAHSPFLLLYNLIDRTVFIRWHRVPVYDTRWYNYSIERLIDFMPFNLSCHHIPLDQQKNDSMRMQQKFNK